MAFQAVTLTWAGKSYTIPAKEMMQVIARIEDHITLVELQRYYQQRGGIPFARMCNALASVLEYVGAKVDAGDIYASMFSATGEDDEQVVAIEAVKMLLHMMVPDGAGASIPDAGAKKKRPYKRAVAALSKRRTKG